MGSIPACAGEPPYRETVRRWCAVYPRVCGGTCGYLATATAPAGLSPRVRGNPFDSSRGRKTGGSIPACAGEPGVGRGRIPDPSVYPRVCGGTRAVGPAHELLQGLSPRVRGNLHRVGQPARRPRSIPACAGEPCPIAPLPISSRVYPRVCGGTLPDCPLAD